MEKPLRFDRMSGLDAEQLDALEQRVDDLLAKPWDRGTGRPKELTLRAAPVVTCGYLRQNIIEEVWAEIFYVDQSTISRYITFLTPLIDQASAEFRPSPLLPLLWRHDQLQYVTIWVRLMGDRNRAGRRTCGRYHEWLNY